MKKERLSIVEVVEIENKPNKPLTTAHKLKAIAEKFEILWRSDPAEFDPERDCFQKDRVENCKEILRSLEKMDGKAVVDCGCGYAPFLELLLERGAKVECVDIAETPLKILEERKLGENVILTRDAFPSTALHDQVYDLVLCTETLACIPSDLHRLFVSELARIIRPEGWIVCSVALDMKSRDALAKFSKLLSTEFIIVDWKGGYHRWYRKWIQLFSRRFLKPLGHFFEQSRALMKIFERMCRFWSGEKGISHLVVIGKRRPLEPIPMDRPSPEAVRKQKRSVWE